MNLSGVNFINILCALFGAKNYKAETFGFVIFGAKISYQKRARIMLMKFTSGPNQKRARRYKNQVEIIDLN